MILTGYLFRKQVYPLHLNCPRLLYCYMTFSQKDRLLSELTYGKQEKEVALDGRSYGLTCYPAAAYSC